MEPWSVSQLRELAALSGSAAMAFSHQSPVILDSWCFYMECKDIFGAPLTCLWSANGLGEPKL